MQADSTPEQASCYYLLRFEKINDEFLAGKSIECPQLQDTMEHLATAMRQSLASSLQDLIRILSKCEIFLFLIGFRRESSTDIPELYDSAIEKCISQKYDCSRLYVSKCFSDIVLSLFVSNATTDIPEHIRENVKLLSDGSAAKLGCYEGISLIINGERKLGAEEIEKHLGDLEISPDQQLLKRLCLQLLALYYTDLKEYSKSTKFGDKAIEACDKISNYNLFLISDCKESSLLGQNESKGEQLMLFVHLLLFWSRAFISDDTKVYMRNLVQKLEKQLEQKELGSYYFFRIILYSDFLAAVLRQEFRLDEKIKFLEKSLKSDLTDKTIRRMSERFIRCNVLRMGVRENKMYPKEQCLQTVDTCRAALNVSLEINGKQHVYTALCYLEMGLAEKAAGNYSAALGIFDQIFEMFGTADNGNSSYNDILAKSYFVRGEMYYYMKKFNLAIQSLKDALAIRKILFNEDAEEIADVLFLLGMAQLEVNDFTSALATLQKTLEISLKLNDKSAVILCYCMIALVHNNRGNSAESVNVLRTALEIDTDGSGGVAQSVLYACLIEFGVNESLYMETLNSVACVIKETYKPFFATMYLRLAAKQLKSGKQEAGLASLQEALNVKLEDILLIDAAVREDIFLYYLQVVRTLVEIGKSNLAKSTIDRATKIMESLPEFRQHSCMFHCFALKGHMHYEMGEYDDVIKCYSHALRQLPKLSHDAFKKCEEFQCRVKLANAYCF